MRLALSGVHIADAVISDVVSVPPGVFSRAKWSNGDGSLMLVVRREVAEHTQVIVLPPKHLIMASNPPSTLPSTAASTSSRIESDQNQHVSRTDRPVGEPGESPEPGLEQPEPGNNSNNSVSSNNNEQLKRDNNTSSINNNTSMVTPRELQQQQEEEEKGENDQSYVPDVVPSGARPSAKIAPPTREEIRRSLRALQAAEDLRFHEVQYNLCVRVFVCVCVCKYI